MAKSSRSFICQACGAVHSKWGGKCESCGEWNSLSEEVVEASAPKGLGATKKGRSLLLSDLKGEDSKKLPRLKSGIGFK